MGKAGRLTETVTVMRERPAASGPSGTECLRVMSLNVAHGRKLAAQQVFVRRHKFHANLCDVAAVLRRESPHVVALQEADGPSFWSGDFNHVEKLADLAGYEHHFWGEHNGTAFGRRRISVGTAILSRLPLHSPRSVAFPRFPLRGSKGFVSAMLPMPAAPGGAVHVVSVHLDFLRKPARRRQILTMVEELAHRKEPLIILGDLNCWWRRRNDAIHLLVNELGVQPCLPEARDLATFPARRPRLRLDWILLSPALRFGRYEVIADRVSDHLGVIAEVLVNPAA